MANINFPQQPRSVAINHIGMSMSSTTPGGFSTISLPGHMTPTSGMFPTSLTNSFPSQPLSPNRTSLQQMSSRLLGSRGFLERRSVPALGYPDQTTNHLNAVGFGLPQGSRSYGTAGLMGFQSFGSGNSSGNESRTPPLLDFNEFPLLTNRGHGDVPQSNFMASKQPYVGMVKQPTSESAEFTMSSEDFPALPGTQTQDNMSSGDKMASMLGERLQENSTPAVRAPGSEKSQNAKKGIQTFLDGRVTNIPENMLKDQFGMVGLLTLIRAAETDPNLVTLALGSDLASLGLVLNGPPGELYPNFGGPWADAPCRPQDIDCHIPNEYLINAIIRSKLADLKLDRYSEDLLFYLFYTYVGDYLQLAAAAQLHDKGWRYHKDAKIWLTRVKQKPLIEETDTFEKGTYFFFDTKTWTKVPHEFVLEFSKLAERPRILPGS